MNWNVISATNAIRITSTGQPRCRARPVLTPPSQAPSATRVARGRGSGGAVGSGPGSALDVAPRAVAATAGRSGDETRLESVAVMMYSASHASFATPSRDDPDSTPKSSPEGGLGVVPDGSSVVPSARMAGMSSVWTIRRSTSDVKLAGLCGGVARHWGIDPVLVRVGWALLALSGGIGVILYVAGWLLLPADGRDTAPAEDMFGDTLRKWPREVWVAIVVIACVAGFALFSGITPFGIGPAIVVALVWYFGFYRKRMAKAGHSPFAAAAGRAGPAGGPVPLPRSADRRSPRRPRPGSGGSPSTRRPSGRPFPRSRPGLARPRATSPRLRPPLRPPTRPAPAAGPVPVADPEQRAAGGLPRHPRSGGPLRRADGIQRSRAAGPSRAATVRSPAALGDAAGPGPDHGRPRHRGLPGRRHHPRRVRRRGAAGRRDRPGAGHLAGPGPWTAAGRERCSPSWCSGCPPARRAGRISGAADPPESSLDVTYVSPGRVARRTVMPGTSAPSLSTSAGLTLTADATYAGPGRSRQHRGDRAPEDERGRQLPRRRRFGDGLRPARGQRHRADRNDP